MDKDWLFITWTKVWLFITWTKDLAFGIAVASFVEFYSCTYLWAYFAVQG